MNKMNNSITNEITNKYINKYLESSSKISYADLATYEGYFTALYKNLPDTEVSGYPVASDYVDQNGKGYSVDDFEKLSEEERQKCDLRFHYLPYMHELYVGTTGSGKTTGCVEPQLRAISHQKNKPNLFLTDPKGELFKRNARHLKEQGYVLYLLNFKDISRSHKWNPLLELYDKKMEAQALGKGFKTRRGAVKSTLVKYAYDDAFSSETYIEYDGKAFPSREVFDYYIAFQRDNIESELSSMVNQFTDTVIMVRSQKDPSWEVGASQLFKGIIFCMLEDAVNESSGFTKDMMTLHTIQQYYTRLRTDLLQDRNAAAFDNHPLLKDKSVTTLNYLKGPLRSALATMNGYCSVFDTATSKWFQSHIFALTAGNNVDLDNIGDTPYAIFVITRDYDKSDFQVAGMFIDWVYRQSLEKAEASNRNEADAPSTRPVHFLLDEFGNIPVITDFDNKIATSRSRNIWFHLFVQSYAQIEVTYEEKRAQVIIDNCNAQIFLGAQSRKTKEIFSKECGKCTIPTLEATFLAEKIELTEVAVLPLSELDLIRAGELYIKRLYTPVIESQYFRSYVCARLGDFKYFYDMRAYIELSPFNLEAFNGDKYTYKALFTPSDNDDDFEIF